MVSRRLRKPPQRQTVDEDPRPIGQITEGPAEAGPRPCVRLGERPVELVHDDLPPQAPQTLDHPGVVDVPAGPLVQRAWHDHVQRGADHTSPS